MSAAARILDRLARVRQSRPGSWMSACPCCESRRGRPLAITEKDDGRVLLHAFCGCTTEDVLGRLGLEVTDLFDKPLNVLMAPSVARVPAGEVLTSLSHEATVLAVLASDMERGPLSIPELERLAAAARRVGNAADYINARAK